MEQPQTRTDHGDVVFVAGGDDVCLAQGAAGLDDVRDAAGLGTVDIVAEGDVGVRAEGDLMQPLAPRAFFDGGEARRDLGKTLTPEPFFSWGEIVTQELI